jgi:phosphoglycerate dehydrogenase-like enzyme
VLALCARLPEMVNNQQQAKWAPIFTPSIAGKTLLVLGLGDMGGAAAKAAKRLGMRVLGMRRNVRPHRHADAMLPLGQLHKALAEADFVLVATPLTPDTHHLIDARAIAAMKTGAGLINVGRAGVVDYAELAQALRGGKLSGAILDVFDPEPLPASSPLWHVPNLIITPHCSSDDLDHYLPLTLDLAFANVARLRDGKRLKNAVDPATGY